MLRYYISSNSWLAYLLKHSLPWIGCGTNDDFIAVRGGIAAPGTLGTPSSPGPFKSFILFQTSHLYCSGTSLFWDR